MRFCLLVALLAASSTARGAPVEIWSYAFATRTDQPVAGHGSSIFTIDSGRLDSFLYSQERLKFKLEFTISGSSAQGTLTSTKRRNQSTAFQGKVTYQRHKDGCLVQILFHEGVHHVVLERVEPSRCES
jgi:hypothetical protein